MKIAVIINAYNEIASIKKTIEHAESWADEIIVCDGAYSQFPHDDFKSTDGTLEYLRTKNVRLIEPTQAWKDQCVKRTAMFDSDADYFFKLDADEYVANPQEIRQVLESKQDVYWCWTISDLYNKPYMTARIFRNIKGMHYAGRHHWLYDGHNNFITSDQNMNPRFKHRDTPIRLFNLRHMRSSERKALKAKFVGIRNVDELSFKNESHVYGKFTRLVPHPNRAGAPRRPSVEMKPCGSAEYTLTLMISRPWAVGRFFNHLRKMWIPENTELLVVIDSNIEQMVSIVVEHLRKAADRFVGVKYYCTLNEKLPEFSDVQLRRQRVIDNWHILLTEAKGQIIIGAEDDSLPDYDAYRILLTNLKEQKAGFVQANIIGRWAANIHPCWHVDEKDGKPVRVWTGAQSKGLEQIQGCGWYCFVAYTDVMRSVPMLLDGLMPLGGDLRFGYALHSRGQKLLHNWDVSVTHFTQKQDLVPHKTPSETMTWTLRDGLWRVQKCAGIMRK